MLLPGLGALMFSGRDAGSFLQGQLSNDLRKLRADAPLLAGLHSPQGRVLALLRLQLVDNESIAALLPGELADVIATLLRRFVLRAKVSIAPPPAGTAVVGQRLTNGERCYLLTAAAPPPDPEGARAWHLQDLRAGLPQVYTATSGMFTAQQLNLDQLGAIAFDKGCYTGQEIIARTHYRGQVKRRMQLVELPRPAPPAGADLPLGDGRRARLIDSEPASDRHCLALLLPSQAEASAGRLDDA